MSPVMETVVAAAAIAAANAKPIVGGSLFSASVGILFAGLKNCDKIPKAVKTFCDGIESLQDAKDKLTGQYDKKMLCVKPDCGAWVRLSMMAEHVQQHIDAVTKEKVLCEMLAIKAEATNGDLLAVENEALKADMRAMEDSIVEHESALRYLLNKEDEANAKDKSLSMEKQERNRRLDEEENYRSRNKKALRFQPFRTC